MLDYSGVFKEGYRLDAGALLGLSWALIQETFQNQTKHDEGGCPFFFIASGALFRKMVPER
jgi:hypothetical protein